jgi:cation diffusion facilitator CzcD-associated flavoprotein CzcO
MAGDRPAPVTPEPCFAVIVGSGFSGLAMAAELRRAGIDDFVILERADALGGTWRDNHYPGCACDVPSHLYSFSFAPKRDWSRAFAPQEEIRAYLERCADDLDLRRHLRLGREIVAASWDEARGLWTVRASSGESFAGRALILAVGALSNPAIPRLPGSHRFRGAQFHSARWDHSVDLRGKRVAVVGTGASAIQFVPAIQPLVSRLYLLQRSAAWVLPKPDRAYTAREKAAFALVPGLRWLHRQWIYARLEGRVIAFQHPALMRRIVSRECRRHMERSIGDPALRARLWPSYQPGCKRILLSNDFYPALAQPNVEVLADEIAEVDETRVTLAGGRSLEVDAILYGTGFAVHDYLGGMRITGRGGVRLADRWRAGAEAYLGTTIAGFPNLFTLMGPNTGLGHNSMVVMIEGQARYAMQALRLLHGGGVASIECRQERQDAFNAWLRRRNAATVWATGCRSWYLDERGRNTTLWPGLATAFRARTLGLRLSDYVVRAPAERAPGPLARLRAAFADRLRGASPSPPG